MPQPRLPVEPMLRLKTPEKTAVPGRNPSQRELQAALRREEFFLHYQRKVLLSTGESIGCEALVRWRRPDGAVLGPNAFLPALNALGMMPRLTDWVADTAFATLGAWNRMGYALSISINMPPEALLDSCLPERLLALAGLEGIDPEQVILEITETADLDRGPQVLDVLERLRSAGFGLSLDDFGTGASNFDWIALVPLTELKIDRLLIAHMDRSDRLRTAVATIIDLAHRLGVECVAEGIETRAQAEMLKGLGCRIGQGYLFGRPAPASRLTQWFAIAQFGAPLPTTIH